jgi:flagellar M-ring protein FliF
MMGEMGVVVVVALLARLLGVRPLLNKALSRDNTTPALAGPGGAAVAGALPGGAASQGVATAALEGPAGGMQSQTLNEVDSMIDLDRVDGQVKTSTLNKVSEIVDKHPDEAISILRSWLYHDA